MIIINQRQSSINVIKDHKRAKTTEKKTLENKKNFIQRLPLIKQGNLPFSNTPLNFITPLAKYGRKSTPKIGSNKMIKMMQNSNEPQINLSSICGNKSLQLRDSEIINPRKSGMNNRTFHSYSRDLNPDIKNCRDMSIDQNPKYRQGDSYPLQDLNIKNLKKKMLNDCANLVNFQELVSVSGRAGSKCIEDIQGIVSSKQNGDINNSTNNQTNPNITQRVETIEEDNQANLRQSANIEEFRKSSTFSERDGYLDSSKQTNLVTTRGSVYGEEKDGNKDSFSNPIKASTPNINVSTKFQSSIPKLPSIYKSKKGSRYADFSDENTVRRAIPMVNDVMEWLKRNKLTSNTKVFIISQG